MKLRSIYKRLLSLALTLAMLISMIPAQAINLGFYPESDPADRPMRSIARAYDNNNFNAEAAFKNLQMYSASDHRPISTFYCMDVQNYFHTPTALSYGEDNEWMLLSYTMELSQYINLVLYELDLDAPEADYHVTEGNEAYINGVASFMYGEDAATPEPFLGERLGYLHGVRITSNVQENADGTASRIEVSPQELNEKIQKIILDDLSDDDLTRTTMKNEYIYGYKGQTLVDKLTEAAILSGENIPTPTRADTPEADAPEETSQQPNEEEPPAAESEEPEEEPAPAESETSDDVSEPAEEDPAPADDPEPLLLGALPDVVNEIVENRDAAEIEEDTADEPEIGEDVPTGEQTAEPIPEASDEETNIPEEPADEPEPDAAAPAEELPTEEPEEEPAEEEPEDIEEPYVISPKEMPQDNDVIQNYFMWQGEIEDENGNISFFDFATDNYIIVVEPISPATAKYNSFLGFQNDAERLPTEGTLWQIEFPELAFEYPADPVDLLTGSFSWNYTDFSLYGKDDLDFIRYYESRDAERDHGFGYGWTTNFTYELEETTLYARVTFPQGKDIYFDRYYDGSWRAKGGSVFTLEQDGTGYVLTNRNGTVYTFDGDGRIQEIVNLDGSAYRFSYAGDQLKSVSNESGEFTFDWSGGHVTRVTDSAGRSISLDYSGDQLASVENPDADSLRYDYDENNCLTSIEDFNGELYLENEYDSHRRIVSQYVVDQGNFTFTYDADEHRNTCEGENGYLLSVVYDELGRVIESTDNYGTKEYTYNHLHQRTSETDREGNKTSYSHDAAGNIDGITYADGTSESLTYNEMNLPVRIVARDGGVTRYAYNSLGQPTEITDPEGNTRAYTYDGMGNLTSYTDALGETTVYTYDGAGNMTSATDALGNTTRYKYDEQGRLTEITAANGAVTAYAYTTAGKLVKVTDAAGSVQEYVVNGNGFNTSETDWMGNAVRTVYNTQNQPVSVTDREGHTTTYAYDDAGHLSTATDALGGTISYGYDAQGRMTRYTDARGSTWRYTYDANGQMLSTTDPNGNTAKTSYDNMLRTSSQTDYRGAKTTYAYDEMGRTTAVTDAYGNAARSEYDKNGNLLASVDRNGNRTEYTYDAENRLTQITDALGGVVTYTYDALGQMTRTVTAEGSVSSAVYDAVGQAVQSTDPNGNRTAYTYDILGRLVKTTQADGTEISYTYDANGLLLKSTDELGNSYSYTYDKNGSLLTTTDPLGFVVTNTYDALGRIVTTVDQAGGKTAYTYDANGNLTSSTDALGYTVSYEYDKLNRVIASTDARGSVTRYEYDENGNLVKATNPDQGVFTYEYDKLNRLVKSVDGEGNVNAFSYDKNSNQVSSTDGRGNSKRYAYDALNRLVGVTDEAGAIQRTVYDADGRIIKTINENGAETCYTYDANGNIVKLTDAEGNSTTFAYDSMDRVISTVNAKGAATQYEYTPTGLVSKETDADGNATAYTYDANGRLTSVNESGLVTTYAYDALGNVVTVTSPMGAVDALEYDALGRVIGSTDANGSKTRYVLDGNGNIVQTIDALGNAAAFEYDEMNRLSKMTLHRVDEQDGVDEYQVTLYTYDKNGLVTRVVNAAGDGKLMVYDENGNLIQQTDEDGNVNTYAYGLTNLVTAINYADGKSAAFTYDAAGNLVEMQDWNGTTTYAVDLLDRITSVNDHNGKTVGYTYDATGCQTSITYPDGSRAIYEYDILDRMTAVTDAEGKRTTYSYNAHDWKVGMTYPNGWSEEYVYDDDGRMTQSIDVDPTNKNLKSPKYTYTYDAVGNLLHEYKRGNGTGAVKEDYTFVYDALNRLVQTDELYGKEHRTYQYDTLGNLTYEQTDNNKSVDYFYNNLNQLTSKILDNHWHVNYTYDKRGNLLSEKMDETSGNGKPHQNTNPTKWPSTGDYVYDAANRMVEGTNTNGEKSIYNFNGLGMLVQNTWIVANNAYGYHKMEGTTDAEYDIKKPEIVVKDFVLDYNSPVQAPLTETEEGSNGLTYRYTYGLERVSVQIGNITTSSGNLVTPQNTVKLYYHTDRLGSYRYLTDDVKGKVTSWTDYDEWGQITHNAVLKMGKRQLDLVKNYTGHEYDSVLSLYYAKARMYDAQDKRFTQVDPAQQGLNWYTYCANNPIVQVDPNGKYFIVFGYDDNRATPYYYYPVKQGTLATIAHIAGDEIPYVGPLSETILNTLETKYGVVGGNSYASNHNIANDISDWFTDEYKDAFIKNIENANKYAGKALKWCDSINNVIEIKTKVENFGQIHIMDDQVFQLIELSGADVTVPSMSLVNDQPAIKFVEYRMDLAYAFVTQNAKYFWGEPWKTSGKSYFAMQLSIYQAAPEKRSDIIKKYRDSYYSYLTCSSVIVIKNGKRVFNNKELANIADIFQSEFLMNSDSTVSAVLDEFKSYVETPLGGYSAQILPF